MATHQFKLMSSFPSYAIIQESLKLVPKQYFSLKKYIGFLLRKLSVLIYQFLMKLYYQTGCSMRVPKVLEEEFVEDFRQRMNEEPSSAFFTKGQVSLDSVQAIGRDSYTFEKSQPRTAA